MRVRFLLLWCFTIWMPAAPGGYPRAQPLSSVQCKCHRYDFRVYRPTVLTKALTGPVLVLCELSRKLCHRAAPRRGGDRPGRAGRSSYTNTEPAYPCCELQSVCGRLPARPRACAWGLSVRAALIALDPRSARSVTLASCLSL